MFDYRYHALSLAAVLLALAVGVVIGVAIGDSNLVSSAKSGVVRDLSAEVSGTRRQAGQLRAQLADEETFANDLYPLAVRHILSGRSVGLVFLGGSSDRVNGLVRGAVAQGGGGLATVVAVREPLDLPGLARLAAGTRYGALGSQPAGAQTLLTRFGQLVGRELMGRERRVGRELLSRVRGRLLSAFDGQLGKLDGLVVMRADPSGMTPEQAQATASFEAGLITGAGAAGAATVGVELASTEPSQVSWYKSQGIASVDDLDALAGQAALVYALAGAHGAYGTKPTADSLLPASP